MAEVKIAAVARTEFGKGAARRARRDGLVPAVLYGHGSDPVHVSLPGHDTLLALRVANALLSISIDGKAAQLALPKQVQRNPVKGTVEHVDLVIVKRGEKVTVEVTVVIEGDAVPGTLVTQDTNTIEIEAEALSIPESLTVSVEGVEAGTQILAGQVELPKGVTLVTDAETLVVNVVTAPTEEDLEAEGAGEEGEAAEEPEAAEGEGGEEAAAESDSE